MMRIKALKIYGAIVVLCGVCQSGSAENVIRRLSPGEASRLALSKPQPSYPPIARQLHLEGEVKVEASIGEDGSVEDVQPLSGNAVLTGAAVSATKHWKFPPITVEGKAAKAIATLSFFFKM